jgi:hypothetical protein
MSAPSDAYLRDSPDQQAFLRTNRLFYLDAAENVFEGWYFKVRGPRCFGPFQSAREARKVLERMISEYRAKKDSSGR